MILQEEEDEREQANELNGSLEKTIIHSKSMRRKRFEEALKRWKVESNTMEVGSKTDYVFS